jgi:hypothetical protein
MALPLHHPSYSLARLHVSLCGIFNIIGDQQHFRTTHRRDSAFTQSLSDSLSLPSFSQFYDNNMRLQWTLIAQTPITDVASHLRVMSDQTGRAANPVRHSFGPDVGRQAG